MYTFLNKNLKQNVIARNVMTKQSGEIATPCGLAMTEQAGRSMVEMLGVLAVIGVLSVAGIAGYTTAMNKYRANELLHEANKRATVVAMQIAGGKTGEGLSVSEFTQPSGYLFGVDTSYASGDKTFKLTLSQDPNGSIDDNVCSQMKATTGNNSVMQINNNCSEITFNSDLSQGGGNSTNSNEACTGITCGDCQKCENGECVDDISKNDQECELFENYPGWCYYGSCTFKVADSSSCDPAQYEKKYCLENGKVAECFYDDSIGVYYWGTWKGETCTTEGWIN